MDNESDTFSVRMPQKILQKIPLDADDYAIDYPFSMASNNTSDFVQIDDESRFEDNFNESMEYGQLMRHSNMITSIYCVAYALVFAVGLVGNLFVISVVFRVPRMRTVTNLFIANLAIADVLVIVFCVPATLMSNLFVREYQFR